MKQTDKQKSNLSILMYMFTVVISFYTVGELVGIDHSPAYHYETYLKEIAIALVPLIITLSFPPIRKMLWQSFDTSPLSSKKIWFYIIGFLLVYYFIFKITFDYEIFISKSWVIYYDWGIPYITYFTYPVLGFSLYIFSRVILAPIIEEFIYRVFFISFFSKWINVWIVVILQAAIFTFNHPFSPFLAGILGLFLGILYVKTKSIIPVLICHSVWNLYSALVMNFDFWFIPRW
ncbi:CPBP family intramembrane metalloprotease [Salinibacillus aidingensis]|uniref:CPBP family intramembrane metalloprotease n=1 Tax=Salinibacillus aidingensis TaxID=237684 RepID=A0ABP3LME2_9BACI